MKRYYESLSSGEYSVTNTVSDRVRVPYNASYYGDTSTTSRRSTLVRVRTPAVARRAPTPSGRTVGMSTRPITA